MMKEREREDNGAPYGSANSRAVLYSAAVPKAQSDFRKVIFLLICSDANVTTGCSFTNFEKSATMVFCSSNFKMQPKIQNW
jgi:hypothetical protein